MGKAATARLLFGSADCPHCGWTAVSAKNAMGLAAQHAAKTGHRATAMLEYVLIPLKARED